MDGYLDYFSCLLGGILIAGTLFPKPKNATFFEIFLLGGVITYGGALMGSYFYKITSPGKKCECECCHDSEADSDSEAE